MLGKHKRLRAIVAVVGLAASMAMTQVAFSTAAQARCAGDGVEVLSVLNVAGTRYVEERPIAGTCNENNLYRSEFRSRVAGFRASVLIQNNGLWTTHQGGFNLQWVGMSYEDNNSNSLIVLCADDGTYWYCGYLDDVDISLGPPTTFEDNRDNYGF